MLAKLEIAGVAPVLAIRHTQAKFSNGDRVEIIEFFS
jgi:hypothetical protein